MLYTTNSAELKKLETAKAKAQQLCKIHKCSLIDLLVMSIQVQAQNKKIK